MNLPPLHPSSPAHPRRAGPSCLLLIAALAPHLYAAPAIADIQNAASNISAGPNAQIAQGSIFVIKGTGLGPATLAIAPDPFQTTTLSGTSITLTIGSATLDAPLYYTSDTQVAALLPSNTPTGQVAFTVTYNGQASPLVNHSVIASNPAIFTIDSTGEGPGIVTYPDYSLVSAIPGDHCGGPNTACGAANPGDTLTLWATGLGPVSGSDAAGDGLGQVMPDLPLTLWIGGVQAPVVYQGRSGCCIGEDQIVFTVPGNVPTGCAVPLLIQIGVQIGLEVSNTTSIPIARQGRTCTPNSPLLTGIDPGDFTGQPLAVGELDLERAPNNPSPITSGFGFKDKATFQFFRVAFTPGSSPFVISYNDELPVGACAVSNGHFNGDYGLAGFTPIDAGPGFTVAGPEGTVTVPAGGTFTLSPDGAFLESGAYTLKGTGGADVGPFTARTTIPILPTITSPNPANVGALVVTRADGLTVTWKGGGGWGTFTLVLESYLDLAETIGARARCNVPAGAGAFTIPPYILLSLPAGLNTVFQLKSGANSVPFTALGLDAARVRVNDVFTRMISFQVK